MTSNTEPTKALDFDKIDALRKHMLLTVESMSEVLGTTRVNYYNWRRGAKPSKKRGDKVRNIVRSLVYMVAQNQWPNPAVFVAKQSERLVMLKEALENLDKEPDQQ